MEPNQYGTENGITSGIIGIVETLTHIQNEWSENILFLWWLYLRLGVGEADVLLCGVPVPG